MSSGKECTPPKSVSAGTEAPEWSVYKITHTVYTAGDYT